MRVFLLLLLLTGVSAFCDPLHDSLEIGSSVSHSYDARSVFVNPAALAYQTDLNGALLMSSFSYGVNRGFDDEFSTGITYSYLGFGMESLSSTLGKFSRYSFATALPLRHPFYLGLRYVLNRPDSTLLERFDSMDLGFQWRPSRFFSIGLQGNGLNRTALHYIAGITARPFEALEISTDVDTFSNNFGRNLGFQTNLAFEVTPGFQLRGGYHTDYKWQAGLTWNFGMASLFTHFQPASDGRRFVTGFQFSPKPYPSSFHGETALKIHIDGSLGEEPVQGGLFSSDQPALIEILETLRNAEKNPPRVVLIHIVRFPLGLGSAQELFEAISNLRKRGTHVEAFLSSGGLKEYLIASAAHQIHMEPSGELRLWGIKAERYFLTGTLAKIGVEGEFYARGEYKSAPEMFTRKDSSPLIREEILSELKHAEDLIVPLLGRYREMTPSRWKELQKTAIFSAEGAKRFGLVDQVVPYKTALELVQKSLRVRESLDEMSHALALPDRIAVVIANGDILSQRFRLLGIGGHSTTSPGSLEASFRSALSDPRTKAIVLRVNSPGGEVLASQQIASLVENARTDKPVIVSMGDVAASGGYLISAPANRIFANTLTATGSIGVFLGKFNFAGLYKKIDLNKEILSHAPYPGLMTEHRAWSEAEQKIMSRRMNEYYEDFVSYVGRWRQLPASEAEKAAKGRVFLGDTAKGLKLVDENGGYREAIAFAVQLGGAAPQHYEVKTHSQTTGLLGMLSPALFSSHEAEEFAKIIPPGLSRDLIWATRSLDSPFLYLAPVAGLE